MNTDFPDSVEDGGGGGLMLSIERCKSKFRAELPEHLEEYVDKVVEFGFNIGKENLLNPSDVALIALSVQGIVNFLDLQGMELDVDRFLATSPNRALEDPCTAFHSLMKSEGYAGLYDLAIVGALAEFGHFDIQANEMVDWIQRATRVLKH